MALDVICAHSGRADTAPAIQELEAQLVGAEPMAVFFFCGDDHDGLAIDAKLRTLFPSAEVIGCTTAGEYTNKAYGQNGVSVMTLGRSKVVRCAAAMAEFDKGASVDVSVNEACRALAQKLQVDLRELDPASWIGIVLNEGMKGNEEAVNATLGFVAPFLSFLGGSAGDNLKAKETRVFYQGVESMCGSVILLMELAVPHVIVKSCSLEPTATKLLVNKVQGRVVYEIDGQLAVARYAEIVGSTPEQLNHPVFMANPLGVVIDGEPWVRAPIAVLPDGGLLFGCAIHEGSQLFLLRSTDLVGDTNRALQKGAAELGREPSSALVFNCAHRFVEIQVKKLEPGFCEAISHYPVAGFNSYGESWLAHMNQTMIALLFG